MYLLNFAEFVMRLTGKVHIFSCRNTTWVHGRNVTSHWYGHLIISQINISRV
jgi:hypothetical protein